MLHKTLLAGVATGSALQATNDVFLSGPTSAGVLEAGLVADGNATFGLLMWKAPPARLADLPLRRHWCRVQVSEPNFRASAPADAPVPINSLLRAATRSTA